MTQNNTFENVAAGNEDRIRDAWEKNEKKLARIKIGMIIAAAAQAILLLAFVVDSFRINALTDFLVISYLAATVAAYIVGGGVLAAAKRAWGITKKLFFIGWLCVPFPMDIFTGLLLSTFGIGFLPSELFLLPLLNVYLNYRDTKKEKDALELNVLCGTPVDGSFNGAKAV